jgi:hypothetical protein
MLSHTYEILLDTVTIIGVCVTAKRHDKQKAEAKESIGQSTCWEGKNYKTYGRALYYSMDSSACEVLLTKK